MAAIQSCPAEDHILIPDTWGRYLFPKRGECKKIKFATPKAARQTILKAFHKVNYQKPAPQLFELLGQERELTREELEQIGVAVQNIYGAHRAQSAWTDWAVSQWDLLRVLKFALESDLDRSQVVRNNGLFTSLRNHLAVADEAAHNSALDHAQTKFSPDSSNAARIAFLFPEEKAWQQVLTPKVDYSTAPWLLAIVDDPKLATALIPKVHLSNFNPQWCPNLFAPFLSNLGLEAGPLLAELAKKEYIDADSAKRLSKALACVPETTAFLALIDLVERQKSATESLLLATEQFPRLALSCLTAKQTKSVLVKEILKTYPGISSTVELNPEQADFLRKATAETPKGSEIAPEESWPHLLRNPPWKAAKKLNLKALPLEPLSHEPKMNWSQGQQAEWASHLKPMREESSLTEFLQSLNSWERHPVHYFKHLLTCPESVGQELMGRCVDLDPWYFQEHMKAVVARWELSALPLVRRLAASKPADSVPYFSPYDDTELCVRAAEAYSRLKSVRQEALAYLQTNPKTTAKALIPELFGKNKKQKGWAKTALLALNQDGHKTTIREAAKLYGEMAESAIEPLLELNELDNLPAKIPNLPSWLLSDSLAKPTLKSGGLLSGVGLENLLTMLAISKPGEPYAGVGLAAQEFTEESLAEFSWSLFSAWLEAGADSKCYWALHTLGWLGNDETARRLTPLLKKWPGEGAHARAVQGLEVLTTIGTDLALMHLFGLSQKLKFKGLKTQALEKVTEIAKKRGLTNDELGDRLVPDLGLDDDGSLSLDYGPRKFYVKFDEKLKPLVRDEALKERKSLPKPGKSDISHLAEASFARFKALKKDARAVASQQLTRLEMALVKQRRWTTTDFQRFFLDHPLVIHLSRRLVWGLYSDHTLKRCFRVAEDGTLADSEDEEYCLGKGGLVGLVHPFDLAQSEQEAWSEILADYRILQPFPQLGRAVFSLDASEKEQTQLTRFQGLKVESLKVLSLESKGWRKGEALDGGVVAWMSKDIGEGVSAYLDLQMGLVVGDPRAFPEQTLQTLTISTGSRGWKATPNLKLGAIPETAMSELLRDLEGLTQ